MQALFNNMSILKAGYTMKALRKASFYDSPEA